MFISCWYNIFTWVICVGNGYKPVLIRLDQYRRLDGIARRLGVSVGQLVRAIIEAYIESLDERIDYNYYFKLLEENPAKAEEYYNQFCPVCGYKRFEIA